MNKKYNKEHFIIDANKIHNNEYDYTLSNYINKSTKINIFCKFHGVFIQLPEKHLLGQKCPKCRGRINTIDFIVIANKTHNNKYDYSKTNYVSNNTDVIIICSLHGEFTKNPYQHLKGSGCQKCKGYSLTNEEFIEKCKKIYDDKYDYSKVNYINCFQKIDIICVKHNETFSQSPTKFINGRGCPMCSKEIKINNLRLTQDEFIHKCKKIHDNLYDYSKSIYVDYYTNLTIICKKHGEFYMTPQYHLVNKSGCQLCVNKTETKFFTKMQHFISSIKYQINYEWCKNEKTDKYLPFDFVIENNKIIIELDGKQHFKQVRNWNTPQIIQKRDKFKMLCANKNNYSVIRILQEDVYNDKYDWILELNKNIQKIIKEKEIQNIYMCKNNEYKVYL
jgi:very-short-patch-repair endonuclease